jgi:hypothetical protein
LEGNFLTSMTCLHQGDHVVCAAYSPVLRR